MRATRFLSMSLGVLVMLSLPSWAAPGTLFSGMTLVDEVFCGNAGDPHPFAESPSGASQIQTILGQPCRVLPNTGDYPKYFAYRLGVGKGLQAGKAYILAVDYPEDQPRSMFIINSGCEQTYGFHTGSTVGDALTPPYVSSNPESVNYPLSGEYETCEVLFHLHDRFPGLKEFRDPAVRPHVPAEGFWVTIVQFGSSEDPLSAGAAVSRIALYEAPDYQTYAMPLNLPPAGLPQRHLFWREEMSDSVIGSSDPTMRGVARDVTWYEYKARLMKFLGMNTFSKDLLEFGYNQGWDSTIYPGTWYTPSQTHNRWQEIVAMIGTGGYELNIMPYYEYSGSQGQAPDSLGKQRLCLPLTRNDAYTHISWSEGAYCDVTDDRFIDEVAKLLDCTIDRVLGGMRPHNPDPVVGGYATGANCWGYFDFGPNWQNFRIRETWTRSRKWHAGPASPFVELYWHNNPSAFLVGGVHVVPGNAVAETTLNFATKYQSNEYTWQSDVMLPAGQEITPAGRYLIVRRPNPATDVQELAFVGYIAGGNEQLQILPIAATGELKAPGDGWFPIASFFDDPPILANTEVPLAGVWFRTRVSAMPVSFAAAALQRYANECNGGVAITRAQLIANSALYQDYLEWWRGKRQNFLNAIRDLVRGSGFNDQADLLFTWDSSESGKGYPNFNLNIVTDNVPAWVALRTGGTVINLDTAITMNHHLTALTTPIPNWGGWEWQHSLPPPDVENYTDSDGVLMTFSMNKAYTVGSISAFDAFRTRSGLAAIRHYCLNENALDENENGIVGYFVGDMNLAGPYTMMAEARSMANGDPRYIGYLASSDFNRPFPRYVRNFNANFLALPALPSVLLNGAASDPEVVVRSIDAGEYGTYLAVVNTGLLSKTGVQVTLPGAAGGAVALATSEPLSAEGGVLTLNMYPCQLLSLLLVPDSPQVLPGDYNHDGVVDLADYTVWADHYGQTGPELPGDGNGDGTVDLADYTIWADHYGQSLN